MAGIIGGINLFEVTKPIIISMFSGGLDSAGVLWRLLNADEYKDFHIHVHHINNVSIENRDKAEHKSVMKMISELNTNGLKFSYSQGIQDFRYLSYIGFPMDMDVCAFVAAQMVRNIRNVNHIAMGRTITDVASGSSDFANRMERAQRIFKAAVDGTNAVGEPIWASYIFPVVKYSKNEVHDMIPDYLQKNFWSCRKPIKKDSVFFPCEKCHTCLDLKNHNIQQYPI